MKFLFGVTSVTGVYGLLVKTADPFTANKVCDGHHEAAPEGYYGTPSLAVGQGSEDSVQYKEKLGACQVCMDTLWKQKSCPAVQQRCYVQANVLSTQDMSTRTTDGDKIKDATIKGHVTYGYTWYVSSPGGPAPSEASEKCSLLFIAKATGAGAKAASAKKLEEAVFADDLKEDADRVANVQNAAAESTALAACANDFYFCQEETAFEKCCRSAPGFPETEFCSGDESCNGKMALNADDPPTLEAVPM